MNIGRAVGLFNKFSPKTSKGIGQVANIARNVGQAVQNVRNIGSGNGTRPITAPVTRMAIFWPDFFHLEN